MKLKLIVALVRSDKTDLVIETARQAGATGATVIGSGRGEGLKRPKTFFGLDLEAACDLLLFLVSETRARVILEHIRDEAHLESETGAGVAFQLSVEDAVGLGSQMRTILAEVQETM